ncbi:uncharacterized protein O3C94_012524 isoform 3-T3 [Discoglossus pictus]
MHHVRNLRQGPPEQKQDLFRVIIFFQTHKMDTDWKQKQPEQRISDRSVNIKSSQCFQARVSSHVGPKPCGIPLDVFGRPEYYRWRTSYDEAYNMDSEGNWKY